MRSWYAIRARAEGAEVSIYDEIGAYGVSAKSFLDELGVAARRRAADPAPQQPRRLGLRCGGDLQRAEAPPRPGQRLDRRHRRLSRLLHRHGRRRGGDAGECLSDDPRPFGVCHGHRRGHAGDGRGARQDQGQPRRRLRDEVRRCRGRHRRTDGKGDLARRRGGGGAWLCRPGRGAGAHRGPVRRGPVPQCATGAGRGPADRR